MHALQEIGFPRLRPGLGLDVGKRQEGGVGADEKQAGALPGEDLLESALDGVQIGRGLWGADPADGEGLGRRQRCLRIAPQVNQVGMHVTDLAPASSAQLCKNLLATMTKSAHLAIHSSFLPRVQRTRGLGDRL
jgi:hypothetical protein